MLLNKGEAELIVRKRDGSGRIEEVLDEMYKALRRHGYIMQAGHGVIVLGQIDELSNAGKVGVARAVAEIQQISPGGVDWRPVAARGLEVKQ